MSAMGNKIGNSVSNGLANSYLKKQLENPNVLKTPISFSITCIILLIIYVPISSSIYATAHSTAEKIITVLMLALLWLGIIFMLLFSTNHLVIYKDGHIIHRNALRITRKFNCKDIEHIIYEDDGDTKFIFNNGKKFRLTKEERFFRRNLMEKENLKYEFRGSESSVIKVHASPHLLFTFWPLLALILAISIFVDLFFLLITAIFCITLIGNPFVRITYDQNSKILTYRKFRSVKEYDMNYCTAKPTYYNGGTAEIEIYENEEKVANLPMNLSYKNRAKMVYALCHTMVYPE